MRRYRSGGFHPAVAVLAVLTLLGMASHQPPIVERDIAYAQVESTSLLLDVYYEPEASGRPVLLLVHGGSWRRRDKADWAEMAPRFVEAGYTAMAVNYRLVPDTIFPGPVEDLRQAVAWARENAVRFGGDPNRVGMLGTSAGAHLSLMAATTASAEERPDAVGAISAPINLRRLHRLGILTVRIERFLGCPPWECPGTYWAASPADQTDQATPPVFMAYSTDEIIPVGQGRLMLMRMSDQGTAGTLIVEPGRAHGLVLGWKVFDETVDFFDRNL